jgi:hypothetical protein
LMVAVDVQPSSTRKTRSTYLNGRAPCRAEPPIWTATRKAGWPRATVCRLLPPGISVVPKLFWRYFRLSRKLFEWIIEGVRLHDPYFKCKPDATDKLGFSCYQKCSAAIRMLAYAVARDLVDEYMRMSESTCIKLMYNFWWAVILVFGEE